MDLCKVGKPRTKREYIIAIRFAVFNTPLEYQERLKEIGVVNKQGGIREYNLRKLDMGQLQSALINIKKEVYFTLGEL